MAKNNKVRDNVNVPLSWMVTQGAGNGASGRPFPTIPSTPPKPATLPHAGTRPDELPRAEPAAESTAKGLKGGEDEC